MRREVTFSNSSGRVPPGTLHVPRFLASRVFVSANNRVRLAGLVFIYGVMIVYVESVEYCGDTTADSPDCLPERKMNDRYLQ